MPNPLIEKLDAEFSEKFENDFADYSETELYLVFDDIEDYIKSYLHSRDLAIIEGIENEINQQIQWWQNATGLPNNERLSAIRALLIIINILNSFKPKR